MHALEADHLKSGRYTSMFADRGSYSKECIAQTSLGSHVDWMKAEMKKNLFDFIREADEFQKIISF